MAIVLATFILAIQEILDLLYFALLFINDEKERNALVAKNACYTPQRISHGFFCSSRLPGNAFLGFARKYLIVDSLAQRQRFSLDQASGDVGSSSSYSSWR